ncbi:hypothetical protein [Castellaniella ginsengisoli]|uniref:EscE/YscE/SsaE family type III secretion system needle protein co-chaperone n=1 Tax=Castellaniella ginsengisoli TaxID=546114 RepID=A0AB39CKW5_9BURK
MTTTLTDLEARLAAPGGAALRDTLSARAARMEASLRLQMADGLPRKDFQTWQAVAAAAAAAQAILASWPVNDTPPADPQAPPSPL